MESLHMENETQTNTNSAVSWIALVLGIIALILSIVAFNRSGTNIEEIIEREVSEAVQNAEEAAQNVEQQAEETLDNAQEAMENVENDIDRTAYIARLQAIRAQAAAGATAEDVANDIAELRADLETDLANLNEEVQSEWRNVLQDMEVAEDNIRAGTADALSVLDTWITQLQADVEEDAPGAFD